MSLITIKIFDYLHEATLVSHKLKEAGIPFFISNESINSIYPLNSGSIGGIELKVDKSNADEAKKLMS